MAGETKWTPGPWTADGHLISVGPHRVCVAVAPLDGPDASPANALLIAAAPDLYDALTAMMEANGCLRGNTASDNEAEAKARAALSRARGEQP